MRHRSQADPAPALIVSSVVRGAQLRESHGGLCIVDFATGRVTYVVDWNSTEIDVEGRGGDRGLRGVAVVGDFVYALSSTALLKFDPCLRLLEVFGNRYLKHCHEISAHRGHLHVVSTGFDAVLSFDLAAQRFDRGLHLQQTRGSLRLLRFDPQGTLGPEPGNVFHLNSVKCDDSGLYFAGLRTGGLLRMSDGRLTQVCMLPPGTHNAQPFRGGVIYNDTDHDRLRARFDGRELSIPLAAAEAEAATWLPADDPKLARPLFARGLWPLTLRYVAAGFSPSTVTIYDLEAARAVSRIPLSRDVRNAIHGLTVWPFPSSSGPPT